MERWLSIPSLLAYEASSEGRIRCVPHVGRMPHGGTRTYGGGPPWLGVWEPVCGRFVFGYRGKTYKVARLICEAFHGPPPFARAVVMHRDENAANNRSDNLSWGTQKENLNAPGFLEYCRSRTGENNPYIKGRKAK